MKGYKTLLDTSKNVVETNTEKMYIGPVCLKFCLPNTGLYKTIKTDNKLLAFRTLVYKA